MKRENREEVDRQVEIERTVAEYQAILQEKSNALYTPWREKAPVYTIARCPGSTPPNRGSLCVNMS